MTHRFIILLFASFLQFFATNSFAAGKTVKISEQTSFYLIDGRTAPAFALSMSKRGPYSRHHRRRAWATASKDMTYQITRKRNSKGCKVVGVKVKLKITYKLPKLRSLKGVSRRHRNKWNKMYSLLNRHERVHGKNYRRFAYRIKRALLKLRKEPSCRSLDRKAAKLVKRLNAADQAINRKFDANDGKNYRRMVRIYSGSK